MLLKASPHIHFTLLFSFTFLPILERCLVQTETTSGSSSNQSTKLNPIDKHSLTTPPSPPPIMAAFEFLELRVIADSTNCPL